MKCLNPIQFTKGFLALGNELWFHYIYDSWRYRECRPFINNCYDMVRVHRENLTIYIHTWLTLELHFFLYKLATERKWPTFCRRNFQIKFLVWKCRSFQLTSLKTKDRQFNNFVVTGDTVCFHYDNLRCHQRQQSCQIDDLLFSVIKLLLVQIMLAPKLRQDMKLKRKFCHLEGIFINGCTGSCHFGNFWCNQWWKLRQNDNISGSMCLNQRWTSLLMQICT